MDEQQAYVTAEEAIEALGVGRSTFYKYARVLERFRRIGERRTLYRAADVKAMAELQRIDRPSAGDSPVVYTVKQRRAATPRNKRRPTR